jgi:TolB protein
MCRNDWLTCCVITLLLTGCTSVEPEESEQPAEALRLEARSETRLTGAVGTRLAPVPVVRLATLEGNPAPGREIRFLVSGGGSIERASQRTDTAGLASPGVWTLGTASRPQTLTARSEGVADLVFTAVAEAGPPATMEIVAGNHQTAAVGAPLRTSLQVKLADRYGNPVPQEPVTYTVILGNGSVLGDSLETDSLGVARSGVWTLGGVGAQLVRASATGKVVLFEALACEDPCRGRDLLFTKGEDLYTLVDGVTTLVNNGVSDPAWSPDGRQIAFATYDRIDETVDLYLMEADGSHAALRANGFAAPSWSPDGRRLAVRGPAGVYALSVEQDDAPPVLLTKNASDPAWSPDGTRIAFVKYSDDHSVKVMNPDGSAVTTLVRDDEGSFLHPTWSPDSRRLAFTKCDPAVCNLFAVNADGTDLVRLSMVNDAFAPAWSPDGSRIAFTSGGGIVWVPADGTLSQPIPMVPSGNSPAWRP